MSKFDAREYTIGQGWDFGDIERTAHDGVAFEDRENIEEIFGADATDEAEAALLSYCRERVAQAS